MRQLDNKELCSLGVEFWYNGSLASLAFADSLTVRPVRVFIASTARESALSTFRPLLEVVTIDGIGSTSLTFRLLCEVEVIALLSQRLGPCGRSRESNITHLPEVIGSLSQSMFLFRNSCFFDVSKIVLTFQFYKVKQVGATSNDEFKYSRSKR